MEKQNKTKKPIDYSKGKIYKIVCNTTGLIYVGSTIQKLCERLRAHRSHYKLYLKGKSRFYTSFDIIKNNNYEIILIENCPCNSKEELHREERKYIESIGCVNKVIPTRTKKEWITSNIDKIKKQTKTYYENNKEKLNEKQRIYYENNKEEKNQKKRQHYQNTKGQQKKEYYEKNKKEIQEKQRIYRENNKEKYNERQKEYHQKHKQKRKIKVECEYCKTIIGKDNLRRHQRTNKCQKFQLSI